jgi:hypothetical protein
MKDCSAAMLENAPLDPRKLPNYVYGMVLGPTDFRQVLENFEWKHRNSNLLLHGSGTVCGLKISVQMLPSGTDVEVVVSSGFAISPRGRWIRVERDQCAPLNQWLQSQDGSLPTSLGPGAQKIYVTLCYNQCLTDLVPIAGQQCAPDASNRAPSRILESFRLRFSLTPPPQPLEDRARLFGSLMRRVTIVDPGGSLVVAGDSQMLLDAVRALAQDPLSMTGSLSDSGPIHLDSADAEATIREALIIWVTEVCPNIRAKPEATPLLDPAADDCLLLAAIDFSISAGGQLWLPLDSLGRLQPGAIVIDETERPVLVPSRLLQELFPGAGDGDSTNLIEASGTVTLPVPGPGPVTAWAPFETFHAQLPAYIPPDALIEFSVESSDPPLLQDAPAASRNVALTLVRSGFGSLPASPIIAATYISQLPNFISVTVGWRWYRG